MSYETWSDKGYGFPVEGIRTTKGGIERLLELAPKYKKALEGNGFLEELEAVPEVDPQATYKFLENYFEDAEWGLHGLAQLLHNVINELAAKKFGPDPFDGEGLFSSAEDFDGNQYILLCPFYPWGEGWDWLCSLTVRFPNLNAEIDALYQEAINAVSIEGTRNVRIDYYDVQNGG